MRGTIIILAAQAHALVISRAWRPTMSMARAVSEDEAKRVWFSRLDVAWGKGVVAPVNQANEQSISEEEAKKAWLARLDAPTWGKSASTLTEIAKEALVVEQMYDTKKMSEEEAKKAWLARLDAPTWGKTAAAVASFAEDFVVSEKPSEEEAKRAWLARLDVPSWGKPPKMSEEEAKKRWLARLDVPSWGPSATGATTSSTEVPESTTKMSEEEAKKAWLARLDAPSWGQAAKSMVKIVNEASAVQGMMVACDKGDYEACDSLSREEEAKKAWLSRLDVPMWGAAAAAMSAVAAKVDA